MVKGLDFGDSEGVEMCTVGRWKVMQRLEGADNIFNTCVSILL